LFAITKSSDTVNFYINGSSIGTASHTETYSGSTPAYTGIGYREIWNSTKYFAGGDFQDLRARAEALSADHIATEYQNQNDNEAFLGNLE
jgi:hypothetical protein